MTDRLHHERGKRVLHVWVEELIRFYDEQEQDNSKHSGALSGLFGEELAIAVFEQFVERAQGRHFAILDHKRSSGKPTGPRLDAWLQVGRHRPLLYQTEVKNWSAHSIGGKPLAISASHFDVSQYKKDRWRQEFDKGRLLKRPTRKVLQRMRPPDRASGLPIRPLLIYWAAMHPKGLPAPFFSVRARRGNFKRLWVFSVSSYLRRLRQAKIKLQMPQTQRRLALLDRIVAR